ncbi:MAG: hypothetical protein II008_05900 [Oscillospiraceae bacterium]|nr:hypothetical protein [Oscillospiraceae bacterium]
MAFIQTNVNYAAEYSRALAEAYPYLSYFGAIWASPNSRLYKPGRGATMYIPTLRTSGAKAVNRDRIDGVFTRNWNNDFQAVQLDMYRYWDTLVDPMDILETGDIANIANITRTFNQFQKVPEMDAYLAAKLAGFAAQYGGVDSTTLTSANILAQWDAYLAEMKNRRVRPDRAVCYMTPDIYTLLKQATGMTRFIEVTNGIRDVDRNIARLDGVLIIEVPKDMMLDAYDFTEGYVPVSGAKQINMMLVDPEAVGAPIQYETSMMSPPTAQSQGKLLYFEAYRYGAFSLMERGAGFIANMSAAATLGALTVASAAGTVASGDTVVTVTGAMVYDSGRVPMGYALYYTSGQSAAVSLTYGSGLPTDGGVTWTQLIGNPATIASQTAGKYITVALVEQTTGKVVAGGNTTLVVKA